MILVEHGKNMFLMASKLTRTHKPNSREQDKHLSEHEKIKYTISMYNGEADVTDSVLRTIMNSCESLGERSGWMVDNKWALCGPIRLSKPKNSVGK